MKIEMYVLAKRIGKENDLIVYKQSEEHLVLESNDYILPDVIDYFKTEKEALQKLKELYIKKV